MQHPSFRGGVRPPVEEGSIRPVPFSPFSTHTAPTPHPTPPYYPPRPPCQHNHFSYNLYLFICSSYILFLFIFICFQPFISIFYLVLFVYVYLLYFAYVHFHILYYLCLFILLLVYIDVSAWCIDAPVSRSGMPLSGIFYSHQHASSTGGNIPKPC